MVSLARGSVRATLALLPPDATREVLQGYLAHTKQRPSSEVTRGCRLHGVGSHASGFYAMLVLISGIDAHGASAADAVPN